MAECNLCSAPVLWARTVPDPRTGKSKSVPLDAEPSERGNCWFVDGKVVFASKDRPRPQGVRLFRAHFIGCEGHKAKKRLERALAGEPDCTCEPDECYPTCPSCVLLEIGAPCRAVGLPGS